MKVCLSENGHSKEFKPLKELFVKFAQMEDSPFGKSYNFIGFNKDDKISKLLDKVMLIVILVFAIIKNMEILMFLKK